MANLLVGDGDSSAFLAVIALNKRSGPYENNSLVKEECINHMCKCMGTHLRKSKQDVSATTMTKTGKSRISLLVGKGRLTDDVIGALQSYYEKAI